MRWFVITPNYTYVERILDDGTGPTFEASDVIEVVADTRREAISKGVKEMLNRPKSFDFKYMHSQRADNACPYTGVRAEPNPFIGECDEPESEEA